MVIISIQRFAAVLGVLLLLTSALAQTPVSPIDAKMRQNDERLNAPVTLSADRIYLGELLEALSAKTGVTLSMDNTDNFSGILIACDLKATPLADVMNSLWSLVGFKSGRWEWKVVSHQTPFRYLLRPTPKAHELTDLARKMLQEMYEARVETLMRMAAMSSKERALHGDLLLETVNIKDPERTRSAIENRLADDKFWAGITLFAKLLSPEQRMRVLREEKVMIPLASLSKEDRQTANVFDQTNAGDTGAVNSQQEPVNYLVFQAPQHQNFYAGRRWEVMVGFGGESSFSSNTGFGMDARAMEPLIAADWILPGDMPTLAIDSRPITSLPTFRPEEIWTKAPAADRNLAHLAAAEGVSFMAVVSGGYLTMEDGTDPPFTPLGITPTRYFSEDFWLAPHLMHKWRGSILLIHYPEWFYQDPVEIPLELVKRLRTSLQQQDGLLSLKDVAEPLTTLSPRQLWQLTTEFPFPGGRLGTLGPPPYPDTPICAFYKLYPKVWSERGIPIDLKMQTFLQDARLWPHVWQEHERVTAVRIIDLPMSEDSAQSHRYTLQLRTNQRDWMFEGEFQIVRITPK